MKVDIKAVLKGLESFATATVPGVAGIDAAVRAVVNAKSGADKEVAAVQALLAAVQLMEAMGQEFATEPSFQSGILQVQSGVVMIMKAVNDKHKM